MLNGFDYLQAVKKVMSGAYDPYTTQKGDK